MYTLTYYYYIIITITYIYLICGCDYSDCSEAMLLVARRMGREQCCNRFCLSGMNMSAATNIMLVCLDELKCFNKKEKKHYIHSKILQSCWTGKYTDKGYYKYEWRIGLGNCFKSDVCREAFMLAYDIKPTYLQEVCHHIKNGNRNTDSSFYGNENIVREDITNQSYNELINFAKLKGIKLTIQQLAALQIPNTQVLYLIFIILNYY